ncbi:MAG: hypothetical protein R2749_01495 [Acidimicrobiales bacterium]
MGSLGWLARYRQGHRWQVWHELRQLGAGVRQISDLALEAQEVCDEMARRARQNVEVLVERLTAEGYRFHTNDAKEDPVAALASAGQSAQPVVDWLHQNFDAVPMSLVSWLRIVGDVWLVGTHPAWSDAGSADPFVFEGAGSRYEGIEFAEYFAAELDAHRDMSNSDEQVGPFVLPVAPDRLHKANVSGGTPYGLVLPDGCAEGLFVAETTIPMVSYLNWVFRNGGFPGPASSPAAWEVKRRLAHDLLPL